MDKYSALRLCENIISHRADGQFTIADSLIAMENALIFFSDHAEEDELNNSTVCEWLLMTAAIIMACINNKDVTNGDSTGGS